MSTSTDRLFENHNGEKFSFNESVATVFDDMISRSVPYYKVSLELMTDLIIKNSSKNDHIIDLGCSTASTLLNIQQRSPHDLLLTGVDNSPYMLEQARKKAAAFGAKIELLEEDITLVPLNSPKVVISNFTLQFIPPQQRQLLINKIYQSLKPHGIFIFSEKVTSSDTQLNNQLIDIYYDYKTSQGYSQMEIVKKKEALENVLVPNSDQQNIQMLQQGGFEVIEILFKWVNFVTYIAKKV
jgi:tRNA (cmo5U34)-methyltransferase